MKKILLYSLICCTSGVQANDLSDAIRASDVNKVKLALIQLHPSE